MYFFMKPKCHRNILTSEPTFINLNAFNFTLTCVCVGGGALKSQRHVASLKRINK